MSDTPPDHNTDDISQLSDEDLMRLAMDEAKIAAREGEVPIGCVIWHIPTKKIIGRGYNRREQDQNPCGHAEIIALQQAARELGHWRVTDSKLIVTLEPCPMCAGAIVNSRVPALVYGCDDPKAGAVRSLYTMCEDSRLNHRVNVTSGVLSDECATLLRDFFQAQRAAGKNGRRVGRQT